MQMNVLLEIIPAVLVNNVLTNRVDIGATQYVEVATCLMALVVVLILMSVEQSWITVINTQNGNLFL